MIYFNNAADSYPRLYCVNEFLKNPEYFITGRECICQKDTKKQATEIFRSKIKDFFNIPDDFLVTITSGATEAANLVIQSFYKNSNNNNYVIIGHGSHNSVIRPCYELYGNDKVVIHTHSDSNPSLIDINQLSDNYNENCQFISFSYQCNFTGSVLENAKDLIQFLDEHNADKNTAIIFDITQLAGNCNFDLTEYISKHNFRNIYLFGTTHKALGSIPGTGFLIHPKCNNLKPLMYGGTGNGDHLQPRQFPQYLECGTYNITSIACSNEAITYFMSFMDIENEAKSRLVNHFISTYSNIKSKFLLKYLPIQTRYINPKSGIINLIPINQTVGEYVSVSLFKRGFVTRYGCHCCSKYNYFGNQRSLRFSFNSFNTTDEIDQLFNALSEIIIELVSNDR